MPKFKQRCQLLNLDVYRIMAKEIVHPKHTLAQRRQYILAFKKNESDPQVRAYVSSLAYMYAIARCNVATKSHEPLNLFDLPTLITLAFAQYE